jgi:hypothetical protein
VQSLCAGGLGRSSTCPGRDAARSPCEALLRRTGTVPSASARYGPGSAAHRSARATRCAASGARKPEMRRSRTCECIPIPVPKTSLILTASCSKERGARERHGRGAGCGGRGSVRREGSDGAEPAGSVSCKPDADVRRWRVRPKSCGPGTSRGVQGSVESCLQPEAETLNRIPTVTINDRATGESTKQAVRPLRAERWEAGVSVVTNSYALFLLCTRGCGCTGRPAFRTPSLSRGRDVHWQSSDAWRREIAKLRLFEIRINDLVSRARCSALRAASQNRDPG